MRPILPKSKNKKERSYRTLRQKATKEMSRTSSVLFIDSPIIYGDRVETSKPYHLIYIDNPYLHLMLTLYTYPSLLSSSFSDNISEFFSCFCAERPNSFFPQKEA